jgi:hypothetical protein
MAFRFLAKKLILGLAVLSLSACFANPTAQKAFAWQPESVAEKELRLKSEALQSSVGEGGTAGFTLGAVIGGLTGGTQGAFIGARLGRFVGATSGAYVRGLQEDYATREAQLDQLAKDLELNNSDLESAIATMRMVLIEQQAKLASARRTGDAAHIARAQESATGTVALMNKTVEAATQRQAVLGEARSLVVVTGQQPEAAPINARYAALADRISSMRSIANTLVSEI